ncbi:HAD-IIA family hydrolase [Luteipulveratus flavus]|uniref:HAD-IIA family hydrolase n=1 Tax=Luteipulveratus flavus TaxID=3031728 RepID=A0ABT6C654_9MICO|nr:HAD-IIA family hydrolase [Luteipulveratus sp. YIM 133296]MDF8264201.1 HAD-IIA family hydrolase [Luteipulveratus sp. YIM 133296]
MASLIDRFRGLVCDLDGVVYAGPRPVPGAVDALERAVSTGRRVVYATNNASRPPEAVAQHLSDLGLSAGAADVITSSVAGAQYLADRVAPGSAVLAVGGPGVAAALSHVGLDPVAPVDARAASGATGKQPVRAVLQGYGADVTARDLAEAAHAIQHDALWVATNVDRTLPTDRGVAPGNGTLVDAVRAAVGRGPAVIGKPGPAMYELAARTLGLGPSDLLGVGDRLETDIAGARAAAMPSALVLTGVHGAVDLLSAPVEQRPDFVIEALPALHEPYEEAVRLDETTARCGRASARVVPADRSRDWSLHLDAGGGEMGSIECLRAAALVLWAAVDRADLDHADAAELWRSSVG